MRWLPKRGDWTPLLPWRFRRIVVGVIPLVPISFGFDYILPGDDIVGTTYTAVEAAMPIQAWGVLCLVAGLVMLTGLGMRWVRWLIAGAWAAGSVLFTLAVGRMSAVVTHPWWDEIAGPSIMFVVAAVCFSLALGYYSQRRAERDNAAGNSDSP